MTSLWTDSRSREASQKVSESVTLVVGQVGAQKDAGGDPSTNPPRILKIRLTQDVADSLRQLCSASLQALADATIINYTADAELGSEEAFFLTEPKFLA